MVKVIIVEDERFLRQGIVMTTPWQDFDCVVVGEACEAYEALDMIERLGPDLVITDIRMPGMTGLELIQRAQKIYQCEFIIISGHSEFQYAKQALELGVRGYLLKPIDDDEFASVIKQTIAYIQKKHEQESFLRRFQTIGNDKQMLAELVAGKLQPNSKTKYLDLALQKIRENCTQDITFKSISESLHISERYLGKLFKENTEYTFLEYLTICRIAKAVDLLDNSDMKVYEIAANIGYTDTRYFSSLFKKILGVTPSEYKNLLLTE